VTRSIAEYEIEGELGRGSVGRVYRARHRASGAVRAIKVLEGSPDSASLARFEREARTLAECAGPGVVGIHGSGKDGGRFYLVMDLLPGGSLRERLRERRRFPWAEAVALVAKLATALERCHRRGLVHRDVKPENVLFDERGEPCLVDFGCVHDLAATTITESDAILGTPLYVAPEQFRGERPDAAADVYSLGIVLYELVTGARPYTGTTVPELLRGARRDRRAASLAGDAPLGLDAVVDRALAFEPDARHESAAHLARELEDLVGGRAPLPGPVRARRSPWLLGGVVLGLVLALGAGVLASRSPELPNPGDLSRAIERVRNGSGREKQDALAAIARAVAPATPGSAAALVALDAAADSVLADRELVRARHQARRLRGWPPLVQDLAFLGEGRELEEAARLGSPAWFEGDAALEGLRALHAALPASKPAATLHGFGALALGHATAAVSSGRAALRAEAWSALEKGAGEGTAKALRRALESVERLAGSLRSTTLTVDLSEPTALVEVAARDIALVVREPALRCDTTVLLAPFEPIGHDTVRLRRINAGVLHATRTNVLTRVLAGVPSLPPLVRAAVDFGPKWLSGEQLAARARRLEEDAAALEREDPLVAATLFEDAGDAEGTVATQKIDPKGAERAKDDLSRAAALAQARTEEDPAWSEIVAHRALYLDGCYRSWLSDPATEEGRRSLEVGIEKAAAAYAASAKEAWSAEFVVEDARQLVLVIFKSGQFDRIRELHKGLPKGARADGDDLLACSLASSGELKRARELVEQAKLDHAAGVPQDATLARFAEELVASKERAAAGAPR
jgi:serine/threonine-protein kinase